MEQTRPPIAKDDFDYGQKSPMASPTTDAAADAELHVVWLQKFLKRTRNIHNSNCNTTRWRR